MKRFFAYTLISLMTLSVATPSQGQVRLRGKISGQGKRVAMSYDGASSYVGRSRYFVINLDANNNFDTIFQITEPGFYNISRNTLYLTPGDDLTVSLTTKNEEATFEGKGAEANNYMKHRLFPTAGSIIFGGANMRNTYAETRAVIDSAAQARRAELDALTGVSADFKFLEGARITADVLNAFIYYPYYAGVRAKYHNQPHLAIGQRIDSFYYAHAADARPLVAQIIADDRLLDVAVVRNVLLNYLSEGNDSLSTWLGGAQLSTRARNLFKAATYARQLEQNVSPAVLSSAQSFTDKLPDRDFAHELQEVIKKASGLSAGHAAYDLELTDATGKAVKLSDFKGKPIYIDFWATWCGPCIKEAPHFEALSKEFEGQGIVFLAISTDKNRNAWLNYLTSKNKEGIQLHCQDKALVEQWAIISIPRFVLIDKDFRIANAYAPRPSDPSIKEILKKLVAQ